MNTKLKLSVVISAYNEENKIEECLKSIKFADEIVFVDNFSTDKTIEIAKRYDSRIISVENNLMLNVNKNLGFSKAKGEWILSLDADERVTEELADEIKSIINSSENSVSGYWIPRKNILFGKWIQGEMWWPDYQLRLFKNGKGKFPEQHVHEYVQVEGETKKLTSCLVHENYSSIAQYLNKMDKIYTESEVEKIIKSGQKLNWTHALILPSRDFLKTFFMQKGYKDGLHGLVLSLLQAFYMEIVFVKVWERSGFKEENSESFLKDIYGEFKKINHEFLYWFLSSFYSETDNKIKKSFYRIQRKLISLKIKK